MLSHVITWTTARQTPLSMDFSRQEYWSELPFPSPIRVFSNESVLRIRWPKYWSFSFSINPSNEYSGLISFRIDWLDLLAVQGTLKSLQHYSSKALILRHSAFFFFVCFSSTTLLLPTHIPSPSCTHAQSCNSMDYRPPGCSIHGLFQARILEWVPISFSISFLYSPTLTSIHDHWKNHSLG